MGDEHRSFWAAVFDGLRKHPEAYLAAVVIFACESAYLLRVPVLLAFSTPITIYGLYLYRMARREKHLERLSEIAVHRIEATKGTKVREKAEAYLEVRREDDAGIH